MPSIYHSTQVVETLLQTAPDTRRWYDVLDLLRQEMDADGVALSEYDFTSKQGKIGTHVGYDPEYIRLYEERYCRDDPWFSEPDRHRTGEILCGDASEPDEQLSAGGFYSAWLEPQGFSRRLRGVIERRAEHAVYLEMMRGARRDNYTHQDCSFVRSLLPCFSTALRGNDYLWQHAILRDMLDYLPVGVMAVDKQGKVLLANKPAAEELERGKGLLLGGDKLLASAPYVNAKLQATMCAVATVPSAQGKTLVVRRGGHLAPTWIVVMPLGRIMRNVVGQEARVALVFLSLPERLSQPLMTILRTCYGLTPTEERLALLIFEGHRLARAAQELGISRNTARTHMKRIYAKTNTSHQSELVRVLLTGPMGPLSVQILDAA